MSWDAYVNTSLIGTNLLDQAAIYGVDGLGRWAGSDGFEPTPDELAALAKAFDDKSDPKLVQSEGIHVNKVKYIVVKAEDRSIYGVKSQQDGKDGAIAVKSKQAIIIAHHSTKVTTQQAANVVEGLADYLVKNGY